MNAEITVLENGKLSAEERQAALDRIHDYVVGIEKVRQAVDQMSIDRAADLKELHDDGEWVAEYLKTSPAPTDRRALNSWQEDSERRFAEWVELRTNLSRRECQRLLKAASFGGAHLTGARHQNLVSVRSFDPLYRLEALGMEDRIGEAVDIAVSLAGGGKADSSHTKAAVKGITEGLSKQEIHRAHGRKKAESWANQARLFLTRIIDAGQYRLADDVIVEMNQYLIKEAEAAGMIIESEDA